MTPIDYSYGEHPSQFVRLHLPDSGTELPVVAVIHGGFWRQKYGIEYADPLCRSLNEVGVAAAAVEYRRVGSGEGASMAGGGWPMTFDDVAAAVDSLAVQGQRSADGRLDLDRVVAVGHSAGGQLAAWLAHRGAISQGPGAPGDGYVPLLGAVCQAAVTDLVTAAEQGVGKGAVIDLLGGDPDDEPNRYANASPLGYVGNGTRIALVHGTDDDEVPIEQSRRYLAAATEAGDPVTLQELPGGGHYELVSPGDPAWLTCRELALHLF